MSCDNIPAQRPCHARTPSSGLPRLIRPGTGGLGQRAMSPSRTAWSTASPRPPTDRERAIWREDFGLDDNWPVFCEPFRQWVLEDNFPAGRPPLEKVGVQFVPDVTPYETDEDPHPQRRPCDHRLSRRADGHPFRARGDGRTRWSRGFLDKVEHDEIIPIVPPVPDTDLDDYYRADRRALLQSRRSATRCAGSASTAPTASRSSSSRPSPTGCRPARASTGLALESALWCRYCFGTTDSGAVDRAQRSQLGPPAGDRQGGEGRSRRLARHGGYLRRRRPLGRLRRGVRPGA